MYFLETSAKEADNVDKLFMEIAHALIEACQLIFFLGMFWNLSILVLV